MRRPIRRKVSHTTKDRAIKMAYKWVCPATLFCSIFFVGIFFCCNTAKTRDGEKRKAYFHPVSNEVYDTLLLLVQGEFEVPVSKRNRIQRNRVVRFGNSGGCKKLRYLVASSYAGLRDKTILQITNNEFKYRVHNAN